MEEHAKTPQIETVERVLCAQVLADLLWIAEVVPYEDVANFQPCSSLNPPCDHLPRAKAFTKKSRHQEAIQILIDFIRAESNREGLEILLSVIPLDSVPGAFFSEPPDEAKHRKSEIKSAQAAMAGCDEQDSSPVISCGECGLVSGKMKRCACKKMWYCDRDCQKRHWKTHKKECRCAATAKESAEKRRERKEGAD